MSCRWCGDPVGDIGPQNSGLDGLAPWAWGALAKEGAGGWVEDQLYTSDLNAHACAVGEVVGCAVKPGSGNQRRCPVKRRPKLC